MVELEEGICTSQWMRPPNKLYNGQEALQKKKIDSLLQVEEEKGDFATSSSSSFLINKIIKINNELIN